MRTMEYGECGEKVERLESRKEGMGGPFKRVGLNRESPWAPPDIPTFRLPLFSSFPSWSSPGSSRPHLLLDFAHRKRARGLKNDSMATIKRAKEMGRVKKMEILW